jgi:hypothetical protein
MTYDVGVRFSVNGEEAPGRLVESADRTEPEIQAESHRD